MEVEPGSERFRVPKTSFQENVLVNDAVPASTKYKNKWVGCEHFCRMAEVKRGSSSGIRLCWSLQGLRFTQGYHSERRYCGMDGLSLNYWLPKFVMEVAKKSCGRYPPKTVYGIICALSVIWRRKMDPKL